MYAYVWSYPFKIQQHSVVIKKGKVKLCLCLTKHHAMKMYSALNQAPRHEDVVGV
jgi:hypothetical protein